MIWPEYGGPVTIVTGVKVRVAIDSSKVISGFPVSSHVPSVLAHSIDSHSVSIGYAATIICTDPDSTPELRVTDAIPLSELTHVLVVPTSLK